MLQVATGIFLAMHYKADVTLSFDSIQHIMRDVNYGWLLRFMHATGASAFFLVIYIHMARTLYYGSYRAPRELMWWTGQGLLLMLMATAFMGYLLPWGQMSFWGATVITNPVSYTHLSGMFAAVAIYLWTMMEQRMNPWSKPVGFVVFVWRFILLSLIHI